MKLSKRAQKHLNAFRFFRDHAGYVVGQRAQGALALARAEQWLDSQLLDRFAFCVEPDSDPDLSFADTWPERDRNQFYSREHEVLCASIVKPCASHGMHCRHTEVLASLCGIVDADSKYMRVIRAELALEVMPAKRGKVSRA